MKIKTNDGKDVTVTFADGFFEDFTGTDAEMEEILASLSEMIKDGTLLENSEPISVEDLDEEEAEEIMAQFERAMKKSIVH